MKEFRERVIILCKEWANWEILRHTCLYFDVLLFLNQIVPEPTGSGNPTPLPRSFNSRENFSTISRRRPRLWEAAQETPLAERKQRQG
jgi:hypothetical protein